MTPIEPLIFVGLEPAELAAIVASAERRGVNVARIDMSDASDRDTMIAAVSAALELSPGPGGLDAAIDDFADDLLLTNPHAGYLWLVCGLDSLLERSPATFDDCMVMVPLVGDRWRSGGDPFVAALSTPTPSVRARALEGLEGINRQIDEGRRRYPWGDNRPVRVLTGPTEHLPWARR